MTCRSLKHDCYVEAKGMRKFQEQVDSCLSGKLGDGTVILRV